MAGGRRRVGKLGKWSCELSIGDLVLAKVKGFPAWPAKISRPEDWDRAPDPKKYFVLFFGTKEIAFVAPADIQAFTSDVKDKLLARCQAKTVKFFAPAVKEICQAFEQLHREDSGCLTDAIFKSDVNCEALSVDAEEDVPEDGLKDGSSTDGISRETEIRTSGDCGPGLERCTQRGDEIDSCDTRSTKSCKAGESSSLLKSPKKKKKKNKPHDDEASSLKDVVLALSCRKEEVCEDNQNDVERDVKKASRSGDTNNGKRAQMNGQKIGQMTTLSKKKPKESHDVHRNGTSSVPSRPKGSSISFNGRLDEHANDTILRKRATCSSVRESYKELELDVDAACEKKKELRKRRKSLQIAEEGQKEAGGSSEHQARREYSGLKKGTQLGSTMHDLETNEVSYDANASEYADASKDVSKRMLQGRKHGSKSSNDISQKAANYTAEGCAVSNVQTGISSSHVSSDEDDLPPTKRRLQASEALSNSASKTSENRIGKFPQAKKNDESHASMVKSPVIQLHTKRRAVRIYDDDDEERPKTPVHGRPASKVSASASLKKMDAQGEGTVDLRTTFKDAGAVRSGPSEKQSHSVRKLNEHPALNSDPPLEKRFKKVITAPIPHSSTKPLERVAIKTDKYLSGSPRKSPITGGATNRQVSEPKKTDGLLVKVSGAGSQKKAQMGPSKGPNLVSDGMEHAQSLVSSEQTKTISSGRSRNIERNSTLELNDNDFLRLNSAKDNTVSGGRLEAGGDDDTNQSKISESTMSMRNLIAAAQAKRKQPIQNDFHGGANTLLEPSVDIPRRSMSPPSAVQHSLPEPFNILQPDVQGHYSNASKVSSHQDFSSDNQPDSEDFEDTRASSGHQLSAGLSTGGTEAAVARDAFEGMIETLSRTRESIGRATRLAIECAKYGIANEVVELLIQKLESEPDDHRKIDLFFLVDSITQGAHSQKGIAGSSYIPTVQAALPRLLGAAAPRGAAAHENRRQCLKVLRLWMERKILPESLLRRYIDSMGVPNDDASANFLLKRPSRAERAVDDPIREMEGMLVDEYGSNATFQLPGLLSSHIFEDDEDDEPGPSYAEPDGGSPIEELRVTLDSETCAVTPSDRTPCILEDVDGELEMEDVSGHPKDVVCESGSIELFSKHQQFDEFMEVDSEQFSPLCGSPPLPQTSPPSTPPLPSSPPPSPSEPPPPPSTPPLPSSPPPPPSPSSLSEPPPPPFLSLPQSLPVPPSGPQASLLPPMISQQFHLPPSSIPNVSPNLSYQPPIILENCNTPSGNQFAQMAPSTSFRDYGHQDLHVNSQASQPNQHFQTRNPPFPQRPFHQVPPPLSQSSNYVYQNSAGNQLPQHPYSHPYSSPNLPDGPMRYIADEQWRRSTIEFKTENSRGAWMSKGGTLPSSFPSGEPYGREGYFSSPFERPTMNKVGFQPTTHTVFAGASIPGHAGYPSLPTRPDMPAIDRWRPS